MASPSWFYAGATIAATALNWSAQRDAARAEREAGSAQKRIAYIESEHMKQQAGQSIAAAQRQMLEERRQAELLQSRALAVAGASGAGASDTTVVNIISRIAAEGAFRSATALYEGKERARQLLIGAQLRREGGDLQAKYGESAGRAHEIGGMATLFSGAGSLYARYGERPKTDGGGGGRISSGAWLDAGTEPMGDYG